MKKINLANPTLSLMTKEEYFHYRDDIGSIIMKGHRWWLDDQYRNEDYMHEAVNIFNRRYAGGVDDNNMMDCFPILKFDNEIDTTENFVAFGRLWHPLDETAAMPCAELGCGYYRECKNMIERWIEEHMEDQVTCNYCGAIIENLDNAVSAADENVFWCNDECLSNDGGYMVCEDCGKIVPADNMYYIQNEGTYVCEQCLDNGSYFTCEHCEDHFSNSERAWYDHDICERCAVNYNECSECGSIICDDDTFWRRDRPYCERCYSDGEVEGLLSYHSDEADYDHFHYVNSEGESAETFCWNGDLDIGIENEIDGGRNGTDLVDWINDNYEHVYCMHDGSLSDAGIELITHPATLEWHEKFGRYKKLFDECLYYDYEDGALSTGLHCHVSKAWFGEDIERDYNIAKLILLVNKFWEHRIIPFTRRRSDNINQWASRNVCEDDVYKEDTKEEVVQKVTTPANHAGRYKAINTTNYSTVEFRIFRGTLDYHTFIATIQFVDTVCRYVKNHNIEDIDNCTWEDVFAGCKHKELMEYLEDKTGFNKGVNNESTFLKKKKKYRIKSWDDMESEYGTIDNEGSIIKTGPYVFVDTMRKFCGEEVYYSKYHITLASKNMNDQEEANRFSWCLSMLEEVND